MGHLTATGLLARHTLVDTGSPEEARQEIGRIFCPHFLSPRDRAAAGFHAVHRSAQFGEFSLNVVSYGAEVEIDPGELSRFFLLQIPLAGSAVVRCGTETALASPGHGASLLSPTLPTRMRWSDGCDKLIVLVDRRAMQRTGESLAGKSLGSIEFATGVDTANLFGRLLTNHVRLMVEAAELDDGTHGEYLRRLGEDLSVLLLSSLRHSQRAALEAPTPPAATGAVARAELWVRANVERSFSVADIATAAGTSLRSLQDGVRRQRGTTLSQMIETIRLERFREVLADPHGDATVTEIAGQVGIGHLGRAAAAYRRRYGEAPSQTLKRVR
jgi:AraC-like DNA-binding protein